MKNFFYFTRSEITGSIVLIVIIVMICLLTQAIPYIMKDPVEDEQKLEEFTNEVREFEANLQEKERIDAEERRKQYSKKYYYKPKKEEPYVKEDYTLFTFNPNTADSTDFINLGLNTRIASNIVKYRNAGGKFRTVEQFSEIYGLSEDKFAELKPYILIINEVKDSTEQVFEPKYSQKKDTIIELNTADTTLLKLIPGIGSSYAKAIVRYRNQLGGYYKIEQLSEVPYMSNEAFEKIKNSFTIDTATHIRYIEVNRASLDYLKSHPYIDFYQAKEIYELRRWEFELDSAEQLQGLKNLSKEDLERIIPYLSFKKMEKRKRRKKGSH